MNGWRVIQFNFCTLLLDSCSSPSVVIEKMSPFVILITRGKLLFNVCCRLASLCLFCVCVFRRVSERGFFVCVCWWWYNNNTAKILCLLWHGVNYYWSLEFNDTSGCLRAIGLKFVHQCIFLGFFVHFSKSPLEKSF